jgi:uncharacterized protein with LGFP repeats
MATFFSRSSPGRLLGLTVAVAAVVGFAGCSQGTKKVTVNGTVTYKGQPVQSGILQFVGPEGSYSAAAIQSDGTYIITDVVPGEVKVGVTVAPQGEGSSSGEKGRPGSKAAPVSLPDKYRNPETSGLTYTITPDTRELPIKIE